MQCILLNKIKKLFLWIIFLRQPGFLSPASTSRKELQHSRKFLSSTSTLPSVPNKNYFLCTPSNSSIDKNTSEYFSDKQSNKVKHIKNFHHNLVLQKANNFMLLADASYELADKICYCYITLMLHTNKASL